MSQSKKGIIASVRNIISRMVEDVLSDLESQVELIETYDVSLWESLSNGFIRAKRLIEITEKLGKDGELKKLEESLREKLREAVNVLLSSQNPYHKAWALASMLPALIKLDYEGLEDVIRATIEDVLKTRNRERRVRALIRLLQGFSKVFSENWDARNDDFLREQSSRIAGIILQELEVITEPRLRAELLARLADAARGLEVVVKGGNKGSLKWIDTNEAEAMAFEILRQAESFDDSLAGLIKARVAYILKTLSADLTTKGDELFDEVVKTAFSLFDKNPRKAGILLAEVAYYKALAGDDDEAEAYMEEAAAWILMDNRVEAIIDALKVAEKAGRARLSQTATFIIEDLVMPRIRELRDRMLRVGLKAYAADVAAWVSFSLSDRLLNDALLDLYYLDLSDLRSGFQLYVFALGVGRAAIVDAETAESFFETLLDFLSLLRDYPEVYIPLLGGYWLGKVIEALYDIPYYYRTSVGIITDSIKELRDLVPREAYLGHLIDLARGLLKVQGKLFEDILAELLAGLDEIVKNPVLAAKMCGLARELGEGTYEAVKKRVQERVEQISESSELVAYLTRFLEKADDVTAHELARYFLEIVMEDEALARRIIRDKRFPALLKELKKVLPEVVEEAFRVTHKGRRHEEVFEKRGERGEVKRDETVP